MGELVIRKSGLNGRAGRLGPYNDTSAERQFLSFFVIRWFRILHPRTFLRPRLCPRKGQSHLGHFVR